VDQACFCKLQCTFVSGLCRDLTTGLAPEGRLFGIAARL